MQEIPDVVNFIAFFCNTKFQIYFFYSVVELNYYKEKYHLWLQGKYLFLH